jgi:hypothetical protein
MYPDRGIHCSNHLHVTSSPPVTATVLYAIGTDCQDCGPVGFDNFTLVDDDEFWDDDDDYWNFNDGEFLGKLL